MPQLDVGAIKYSHEREWHVKRLLDSRPPVHGNPAEHERLVSNLMSARRAIRYAKDAKVRLAARQRVDDAKRALGERGDVWWADGAPDYNRRPVTDTPYATWFSRCSMDS